MTTSVYPYHKDKDFAIPYATLIELHKIGFKPIPLAEDAKTPNVTGLLTPDEEQRSIKESDDGKSHPVTYIYNHTDFWNEQRIEKEAWRFHNVATTLGLTHLKDEAGNALFLECLDIDSENVYDKISNLQNPSSGKMYSSLGEQQLTFVTKTRKKYGYHVFWLSHTPHTPVELPTVKLATNM